MSASRRHERGQATTEYALILAMMVVVLFVPYLPNPSGPGQVSVFGLFVNAFDIYIDSFHTGLSLPIP
ncbi:MAG: hypothetical protein AAFQ82_04210 [Myxococcota bacterium]